MKFLPPKAWRFALALVLFLGFESIARASASTNRPMVDLDGVWQFATDPEGQGEAQGWFQPERALPKMPLSGYEATADGRIIVPGSWDSQGYGEPTEYRFHQFTGQGWYRKTATIPADWAGRSVFLQVGGVHRSAKFWVNGEFIAEHIGYLSALEFDISDHVKPGQENILVIMVDARQDPTVDPFNGTADGIEMKGAGWGGIWGHVAMEARSDVYLQDVFVQTMAVDEPEVSVTGALGGVALDRVEQAEVEILDSDDTVVARAELALTPFMREEREFNLKVPVPGARLWSPEQPALYRARVSLRGGSTTYDTCTQRFGIRQLLIDGTYFTLNGRRIFLAAAGDDNVYPNDFGALYVAKDKLVARMKLMQSYGFNAVRTHTAVMSPDFYDACDEVGMLVRPEMPFSGSQLFRKLQKAPDLPVIIEREMTNAIVRLRNHPSIYAWSGGNELYATWNNHPRFPYGTPIADLSTRLKAIVNRYHPGAYFVDSLNSFGHEPGIIDHARDLQRRTLDFYSPNNHFTGEPYGTDGVEVSKPLTPKPAINHESHDYTAFPRLASRDGFKRGIVPYWLNAMAAYYEKLGLTDEMPLWEQVSEELVMDNIKLETEAMRLNDEIVGYDFWLFQDFWATANGLVDALLQPKPGMPADKVRNFNADVVLLKTGLELTYRSGDPLELQFLVSNYGPAKIAGAQLDLRITCAGRKLLQKTVVPPPVAQGTVSALETVSLTLPAVELPGELVITARLRAGDRVVENDWSARLFPQQRMVVSLADPLYTPPEWVGTFADYGPRSLPAAGALPTQAVYLVDTLDERLITALEGGATIVLIQPKTDVLPVHRQYGWRAAFWSVLPRRKQRAVGHLVYDHPLTRRITPEHGLNHEWFHLVEGASAFMLDDLPSQPDVLIRSIEGPFSMMIKALLFETRVGDGCLIASGLNHLGSLDRPEGQWVMDQLIQYAGRHPQLHSRLPADYLRERLETSAPAGTP